MALKFIEIYEKFGNKKIFGISYNWLALFVFIFVFLIQLVYVLSPYILWWDEAIYVGMAKFISSFGGYGHWEYFRPPIWPIFLGTFLKLGLTMTGLNIVQVFISMCILLLTFLFSERIKKYSGVISILILSTTFLYFSFVHMLLSEYLSLVFSIASLYLFVDKKYFSSGIFASLSFLTRFPQGILIVVLVLALFIELLVELTKSKKLGIKLGAANKLLTAKNKAINDKTIKETIFNGAKNGAVILIGFLIPLIPYFIINQMYYGGFLNPIIFGAEVASMSTPFFTESLLFYFKTILSDNFLYIFSLIFFIMFFKKKLWQSSKNTLLFIAILLFFAYFTYNPHKEARYIMVALPYLAIAASYGAHIIIDYIFSATFNIKKYLRYFNVKDFNRKAAIAVYAVLIIFLLSVGVYHALTIPAYQKGYTKTQEVFYTFFADDTNNSLLAANPTFLLFTNKPIEFLVNWENALWLLNNPSRHRADYIAFNTCQYSCLDEKCEEFKLNFIDNLKIYPLVFNKTENGCDYLIYSLPFADASLS